MTREEKISVHRRLRRLEKEHYGPRHWLNDLCIALILLSLAGAFIYGLCN